MTRILSRIFLLVLVAAGVWALQPAPADLVVYCSHDAIYAGPFLRRFAADTGLSVDVRYDTEASKSLGLTEQIARESATPRCDVFWNNEPLGTIRLAHQDLLHPYKGDGFRRIPPEFKDPAGRWVGFAARLRVYIVHAPTLAAEPTAIRQFLQSTSLENAAIARPLYGTTRSHFTALWEQSGPDATREWHRYIVGRGMRVVPGNATVKDLVASGRCALGLTDTDDYFMAQDAGQPVAMLPATLPNGATICVPNTVAIIAGCRNLSAAQVLVDYLASAKAELELARSPSRQIPLGPVDEFALPAEVRALLPAARRGYVFEDQATASAACLRWLKSEYLK